MSKLHVCFALLTDENTQNIARKMVYSLSHKYQSNIISARLPQHISLKQSFKVDDLSQVEKYFDEFSKKIKPFRVELSKVELVLMNNDSVNNQILWFEVNETRELRRLHNRLNDELFARFGIEEQGFDGERWKFHSSIAYGLNQEQVFKEHYESIKSGDNITFDVKKIAMFYSPDDELKFISENFITYKVRTLNK